MPTKKIPFTMEAWKAGGKPWTEKYGYIKQLTYFEVNDLYKMRGISSTTNYLESWDENGEWFSNGASNYTNRNLMLEVEIDNTFNLERALAGEPWGDKLGKIGVELFYSKELEKISPQICIWAIFKEGLSNFYNINGNTIFGHPDLIML